MELIRRLYEVEDRTRPLDDAARRVMPAAEALPILERLRAELDHEFVHRSDVVDRCVFLFLLMIADWKRRSEQAFWSKTYRPRKSWQHDLRGHRFVQLMVYSDAISRVIPPRLGYVP
jgi:hypothetical protein